MCSDYNILQLDGTCIHSTQRPVTGLKMKGPINGGLKSVKFFKYKYQHIFQLNYFDVTVKFRRHNRRRFDYCIFMQGHRYYERLCGLVVRVHGYRSGGPSSISGDTRKKVVGLERGPLSLVSTTEELLDRKVATPV
jgi:hypothetical protein